MPSSLFALISKCFCASGNLVSHVACLLHKTRLLLQAASIVEVIEVKCLQEDVYV